MTDPDRTAISFFGLFILFLVVLLYMENSNADEIPTYSPGDWIGRSFSGDVEIMRVVEQDGHILQAERCYVFNEIKIVTLNLLTVTVFPLKKSMVERHDDYPCIAKPQTESDYPWHFLPPTLGETKKVPL